MSKLIVVIGLPGSGKSCYLKKLRDDGEFGWICEDFHAGAQLNSREVEASQYLVQLLAHLKAGDVCAVADIAFCCPDRRQKFVDEIIARAPDVEMEFRCFENDKASCIKNVERRARASLPEEKANIEKFSAVYEYPRGTTILSVYQENL